MSRTGIIGTRFTSAFSLLNIETNSASDSYDCTAIQKTKPANQLCAAIIQPFRAGSN
jgi:hypothetical protein